MDYRGFGMSKRSIVFWGFSSIVSLSFREQDEDRFGERKGASFWETILGSSLSEQLDYLLGN